MHGGQSDSPNQSFTTTEYYRINELANMIRSQPCSPTALSHLVSNHGGSQWPPASYQPAIFHQDLPQSSGASSETSESLWPGSPSTLSTESTAADLYVWHDFIQLAEKQDSLCWIPGSNGLPAHPQDCSSREAEGTPFLQQWYHSDLASQDAGKVPECPYVVSNSASGPAKFEHDNRDRRERFLARNRTAAARCRRKKHDREEELDKRARDLKLIHEGLKDEVQMLRNELVKWKLLCTEHAHCRCEAVREYLIQAVASKKPQAHLYDGV